MARPKFICLYVSYLDSIVIHSYETRGKLLTAMLEYASTGEAGGVLAWGLRGNMYRSSDFGDTWEQVELLTPNNGPLEATLAGGQLAADGRLIVVGVGGVVATSDDAGRSFEVTVRPDRVALANAAGLQDGGILLVGQRGVVKADERCLSAAGGTALTLPEPTAVEE